MYVASINGQLYRSQAISNMLKALPYTLCSMANSHIQCQSLDFEQKAQGNIEAIEIRDLEFPELKIIYFNDTTSIHNYK